MSNRPKHPARQSGPTDPSELRSGDIGAVVERYGIPGFTYHTWSQGRRPRPAEPPPATARSGYGEPAPGPVSPGGPPPATQDAVSRVTGSSRPSRAPVPGTTGADAAGRSAPAEASTTPPATVSWNPPEDLRDARLPLLARMPDTRALVGRLERRTSTVTEGTLDDIPLFDLEELSSDGEGAGRPASRSGMAGAGPGMVAAAPVPEKVTSVNLQASRPMMRADGLDPVYPPLPGAAGDSRPAASGRRADPVERMFREPAALPPQRRRIDALVVGGWGDDDGDGRGDASRSRPGEPPTGASSLESGDRWRAPHEEGPVPAASTPATAGRPRGPVSASEPASRTTAVQPPPSEPVVIRAQPVQPAPAAETLRTGPSASPARTPFRPTTGDRGAGKAESPASSGPARDRLRQLALKGMKDG